MDVKDIITAADIETKCIAIVTFGPETATTGTRPAEYFQVLIDPGKKSPDGNYIRFGHASDVDEINGWQRAGHICVAEILEEIGEE